MLLHLKLRQLEVSKEYLRKLFSPENVEILLRLLSEPHLIIISSQCQQSKNVKKDILKMVPGPEIWYEIQQF